MKIPFGKEKTAQALDEIRKKAGKRIFNDGTIERLLLIENPTRDAILSTKGLTKKVTEEWGSEILSVFSCETKENQVYTVSEFLNYLNGKITDKFVLVQGEIAEFTTHPAGAFFCLKDKSDGSILRAYMRPRYLKSILLEDGMEVRAGGFASIYKPRGSLSIEVEEIELVGEGALRKAYELLRKKLEEEGLFARKRPIPEFISSIGAITSLSGEVIHDFKKNLRKINLKVGVRDVRVQGERAEKEIVEAIRLFNSAENRPDVLVVMRGGGSFEDLAAFNSELVSRAIFGSQIPVICAIGHDRDVPIANLTADVSVSTPSMAAVYINDSWSGLYDKLPSLSANIFADFESWLMKGKHEIRHSASVMENAFRRIFDKYAHAKRSLYQESRRMGEVLKALSAEAGFVFRRMVENFGTSIAKINENLARFDEQLKILNPLNNLKLGYSIMRDLEGKIIKSVKGVNKGDIIKSQLRDGELESKII